MKNIPYAVNRKGQLPECWLFENKQYTYIGVQERALPRVCLKQEELQELGITYKIVESKFFEDCDACEVWDPSFFEEETLTLPLYVKLGSEYRYAEKNHTGKVPTEKTIEAAESMQRSIWSEVEKLQKKKREEKFFKSIKEALGERSCFGFYSNCVLPEDFFWENERFKFVPLRNRRYERTGLYALFNVNVIELDSVVTLEVPEGGAGLFVGTNGWQVKEWCKKLGLKRIDVVGV